MSVLRMVAKMIGKVAGVVNQISEVVITLSLVGILLSLTVTVISRYFFRISAPWVPEYVAYSTAVIGTVGFSSLVHRRSLLAITFVRDRLTGPGGLVFDLIVWIGVILYFHLFITEGFSFAISAVGRFSPSLTFNLGHVRMILPIGGALIVFQAFNNTIQDLLTWFRGEFDAEIALGSGAIDVGENEGDESE